MKNNLLIILFLITTVVHAQTEKISLDYLELKIEAEISNGKWNGKYISKYPNGKIKAEGQFKNNMRVGEWNIYDSTGKKIHARNYSNSFEYERTFPIKSKTGPASLFDSPIYKLKYNAENYFEYFEIKERMILYSKRCWRTFTSKNNDVLFKKNKLYETIFKFLSDTTNGAYAYTIDNFSAILSNEKLKDLTTKNYAIVAFKIKEDNFYDIERGISETRIIGLCPVGVNKKTKDTIDLFWAYYPQLRSVLAQQKVSDKNNQTVKSFDDYFFLRNFSSVIFKVSNLQNLELRHLANEKTPLKTLQQQHEVEMIEMEHRFWVGEQ